MTARLTTALLVACTLGPACAPRRLIPTFSRPTPVIRLAADATTHAQQLGELVIQLRVFATRLTVMRALPPEADFEAGKAAAAYAVALPVAVSTLRTVMTPMQITTAVSPLVGPGTQLVTILTPVADVSGYPEPANLLSDQLGPVLAQARELLHKLGEIRP